MFIKSKNIIEYEEKGEMMIIDMKKNKFYTMDLIGSFIWTNINNKITFRELLKKVSKECEIEEVKIENDIKRFIISMRKKGLIKYYGKIESDI